MAMHSVHVGPDGQVSMNVDGSQLGRRNARRPGLGYEFTTPTFDDVLAPPRLRCGGCQVEAADMPRCSRCKSITYCCGACQTAHWPFHKRVCKVLSEATIRGYDKEIREVLIVTGLGACGPNDFLTDGLKVGMQKFKHLRVSTVNADPDGKNYKDPFTQVGAALATGRYAACVIQGVGGGGNKPENDADFFSSPSVRADLVAFVHGGGTLLLHGERWVGDALGWFGKTSWQHTDYTRTEHVCRAGSSTGKHWASSWYPSAPHAITSSYNVKSCLLSHVSENDALFGTPSNASVHSLVPHMQGTPLKPNLCPFALGQFGAGCIGFFGDVNAEKPTMTTVGVVVNQRLPAWATRAWTPTRACWMVSPRTTKRAVLTILLVNVRNRDRDAKNAAASSRQSLPLEIWIKILKMLDVDEIGCPVVC
eukprot:m.76646 g.76646  ORF g.76646 m.76646 type:complete len:421 (-) comp24920_c0_seq3:204-1466(-)